MNRKQVRPGTGAAGWGRPVASGILLTVSCTLAAASVVLAAALIALALLPGTGRCGDEGKNLLLELEGGPAWQTRNDVQIPNEPPATRFALDDLAGSGPFASGRLTATWWINEKHGAGVVLAPFQATETATPADSISFDGAQFLPDTPTEATYRFNSWRIFYRYRLHESDRWTWRIGFTAKIRDAEIRLEQQDPDISAGKTDLGFVPLLHVGGDFRWTERLRLRLEADGLAGGPGRAFDVAIKTDYRIARGVRAGLGYRTLEGGADVDAVYNFAWLHYLVALVEIGF